MADQPDFSYHREYFRRSEDRKSKFWSLGNKKSPFPGGQVFEQGTRTLAILDQFDGKQPFISNYASLIEGNSTVGFVPTILLDSNIANFLHQYRVGDSQFRQSDLGQAVRRLLEYFISTGCDYNPAFYLFESFSKNELDAHLNYATKIAETILMLHAMDEKFFLEQDVIRVRPDAAEHYAERFGGCDFAEHARALVEGSTQKITRHEAAATVDAIYISLLKIALINENRRSPEAKLDELFDFFENQLGVVMGREIILAAHHFANTAGNLIPLRHGSNWEKVRPKLRASAWDLYLLRQPELHLAVGDQNETVLAHVCTGERMLQVIGGQFVVSAVICEPNSNGRPMVQLDYKLDAIKACIGDSLTVRLNTRYQMPSVNRRPPVDPNGLTALIFELENEAQIICK
jgi:hypothetical protein